MCFIDRNIEEFHTIFKQAFDKSMTLYKGDIEELMSSREKYRNRNKKNKEYIQKVHEKLDEMEDNKKETLQLIKEKHEEILMYQEQVKKKDEEIKSKEHQMKEMDDEIGEYKKQKREMEDELLTIAGLSSLDELKLVLKKFKDLRESEKAEVEVLKEVKNALKKLKK